MPLPPPLPLQPLSAKLTALKGIGLKRREILAGVGIHTIEDLLWGLPYRYIDRGSIKQIDEIKYGSAELSNSVTLLGTVLEIRQSTSPIKRMVITEALLGDETGTIRLVWFNQPHLSKTLKTDTKILVWGALVSGRHGIEMHSPTWESFSEPEQNQNPDQESDRETAENNDSSTEDPLMHRFLPLYRRIATIAGRARQKLVSLALKQAEPPDIFLPPELSKGLPDTLTSLRLLHNPPDSMVIEELEQGLTPAHQRLATEELFAFALGIELRRAGRLKRVGEKISTSIALRDKLKTFLPFRLTTAQRRAFKEIVQDLISGQVMNRMLQGDVGSGKTLVALLTMAMVAETGGQAALLAPTEVLARQHAASFARLLGEDSRRLQLLVGAMKTAEKRTALERIAQGQANYIIGTHALFQESVTFSKLQLIVVDEQHRFGVKQREALKEKGIDPHWLVMSATPIPRSLALALFGDLDQSILDELPPGRQPVQTRLLSPDHTESAWNLVERELAKGHQAFVVSPAIDPSDETKVSLRDIQAMETLLHARFPSVPLVVVHGRLKAEELDRRMTAFVSGEARILLATTVIEVGVDVPNATVMVVDHAERFGLSQLHQLRGRVGRGQHGGHFIMLSKSQTERLKALEDISDGFRIAQKDLEIRGPGEFFGTRQSGLPHFQVADLLRHRQLLIQCREAAIKTVQRGLTDTQRNWLQQEQERLKLAGIS